MSKAIASIVEKGLRMVLNVRADMRASRREERADKREARAEEKHTKMYFGRPVNQLNPNLKNSGE